MRLDAACGWSSSSTSSRSLPPLSPQPCHRHRRHLHHLHRHHSRPLHRANVFSFSSASTLALVLTVLALHVMLIQPLRLPCIRRIASRSLQPLSLTTLSSSSSSSAAVAAAMSTTAAEPTAAWTPPDSDGPVRVMLEMTGESDGHKKVELECVLAQVLGRDHGIDLSPLEADPRCVTLDAVLPNLQVARQIAERATMLRSIVEVWGRGRTLNELAQDVTANFPRIKAKLDPNNPYWRVTFRKHYRGDSFGDKAKVNALTALTKALVEVPGSVRIKSDNMELVHIEVWENFEAQFAQHKRDEYAKIRALNLSTDEFKRRMGSVGHRSMAGDSRFLPSGFIFGRVLANGFNIKKRFEVRHRPYVGATTMNELSAHLAATMANVSHSSVVLDPFCGTSSTLIACANLGAKVVGADIDFDCLGLYSNFSSVPPAFKSKNSRMVRVTEELSDKQRSSCAHTNFEFYNLQDKVVAWIGSDIFHWTQPDHEALVNTPDPVTGQLIYSKKQLSQVVPKYDAIVTDPPFGIREKLSGHIALMHGTNDELKSPLLGTNTLLTDLSTHNFALIGASLYEAAYRWLKPEGRLVFWVPMQPHHGRDDLLEVLRHAETKAFQKLGLTQTPFKLEHAILDRNCSCVALWICALTLKPQPELQQLPQQLQ